MNENSKRWLKTKGEVVLSNQIKRPRLLTCNKIEVRSMPEKRIADFLTKQGITFQYETKLTIQGKVFYPDFWLPNSNTYIEYFGWEHIQSYREKNEMKRKLYADNKIDCIYLFNKGSHFLESILKAEFERREILMK
jgi:hypothetical protein